MGTRRRWRRYWLGLFFFLGLLTSLHACQGLNLPALSNTWPFVEPLPAPQLPAWIEQVSPVGEVQPLAQILIRFKEPLIPLEALESAQQQGLLQKFELKPAIPGQFRFLTPTMVGFQPEQALPKASRFQVTLKAGLQDLKRHRLESDLAWTFSTGNIEISELPGVIEGDENPPEPMILHPKLSFRSNVELDLPSLQQHLSLSPSGEDQTVALDIRLLENDEVLDPEAEYDASNRAWRYELQPKYDLAKGQTYQFKIAEGVLPAQGNLPSNLTYQSQIRTYGPLQLEGVEAYGQPDAGGAYGRFVNGSPQLKFNNPLVADSVAQALSLSPAPKAEVKVFRAYDGDSVVSINPWALEPNTNYQIEIKPGIKDQFGQVLEAGQTLEYRTGDIAPDLWAPTGLSIFPAGLDLRLHLSAVNLPEEEYQADFRRVAPTDLVFVDSAFPNGEPKDLLAPATDWKRYPLTKALNQTQEVTVSLPERLGSATGLLAYGIRARANTYDSDGKTQYREPEFYGLVQLTNLGLLAQWFPDQGRVQVNHLDTGKPVVDSRVELYRSQLTAKERRPVRPCAVAITGADGTARFQGENWQACVTTGKAPELLAIAYDGDDWAFTRTYEYSGSYEYGLNGDWPDAQPQSRGVIFSDRQLYQPGETVQLTGNAVYLQEGRLEQDQGVLYDVTLTAPSGKVQALGTVTTNDFGTFSLPVELSKNQELGFHSVTAKAKNGVSITGEFRVAQFRPPTFEVSLSTPPAPAQPGQTIEIQAKSRYLFGAPVQAGQVRYYVTREKTEFIPPGWPGFYFGRQWFWPEEPPSVDSDVYQAEASLNDQGQDQQSFKISDDLPFAMTYRVEAQVKDVSNLAVAQTTTFLALPSPKLIGLKHDFVATAGQAFPVAVIVTDPDGKAIPGQKVRLELQRMDYNSVTQLQEGSPTDRPQVEYIKVATETLRSGEQPQTLTFNVPQGGSYRLQATLEDSNNTATATEQQIWVAGAGEITWADRYDDQRLSLTLDKETYQVGETATVLIESPYAEADLYFAVVRDRPLYERWERVQGNGPKIQFPITAEILPNAAVQAVLVRRGQPIQELATEKRQKLVKIGFQPFNIDLKDQYLQLKLSNDKTEVQPGQTQTVNLQLNNAQGQPVQSQVTVMVVNEAILQLTGYRPPDLVKQAYADQPIATRLGDNRADVVLAQAASPLAKGWGYGGGNSSALGDAIRRQFQPLAFFESAVLTNAQGQARVSFTLPDDLTTWRVLAVANDGKLHFGQAENSFISRKALVTNPLLPQFARRGDQFSGGVAVTNSDNASGELSIRGTVNDKLKFTEANQQTTHAQSGTQAYRFPLRAEKVGDGKVSFRSQLGALQDGFEVPLPIEALIVTEQVITSGASGQSVSIPLKINPQAMTEVGGLEITLSNNLLAGLALPIDQRLQTEPLPFLEDSATRLSLVASLQQLREQGLTVSTTISLTTQAQNAIQTISSLQRADGGFAAYPGVDTSDPWLTPYAAQSLAQAQQANIPIPASLLKSLRQYLSNLLANPRQGDYCSTALCKNQLRLGALEALNSLGETRSDFLGSLYEQRQQLDLVDQLRLARLLTQLPGWQREARQLNQALQSQIYQTGRELAVNLPESWRWFHSQTTAQAEALQLGLARQFSPEDLGKLVQGLLAQRRQGLWPTDYDTAQALRALVAYGQASGPPQTFKVTAQLGGKALDSLKFSPTSTAQQINLSPQQLPSGDTTLKLQKTGPGTLYYLVAYRYRLSGQAPGRFQGLRVTRFLRPANQKDILAQQGLGQAKPITLQPGQVFDLELEIIADRPVHHLLIQDPLPAGLEAVDASFQTAPRYQQATSSSWQITYQQIHRDQVTAYGDRLGPGVYHLHYLVRSVTPGTFDWPGAEVSLRYAPENFGRTATTQLEVRP
ncbi:Ig-like domain-containing protein [Synechocystis sp. LKSZ1]|uniref:alpha-2-macroglobulin family protein n=1 Tax=Synechocystis sp. LKSZ1 TaxID=3144951 RepID=UPI00336BF463